MHWHSKSFKFGVSPHIWQNDDWPNMTSGMNTKDILLQIAELGFDGCEIGSGFPDDIKELGILKREFHLEWCNKWLSLNLLLQSFEQAKTTFIRSLEWYQQAGIRHIGVAETGFSCYQNIHYPVLEYEKPDIPDMKSFYDKINALAKVAWEYGISLCYHPHAGTIIQHYGEIRDFLKNTDEKYVSLLFDSAHLSLCGIEPVQFLSTFYDRIKFVHLKDISAIILAQVSKNRGSFHQAVLSGLFMVPGFEKAHLDFENMVRILVEKNFEGWIVIEGDRDPRNYDPRMTAQMAYHYIYSIVESI